ncbi:MAG TPA: hypothetical protein PKN02_11450 [Thermotogota bacterium]|nr:hypothetical protein [Thermotogota bacterium]
MKKLLLVFCLLIGGIALFFGNPSRLPEFLIVESPELRGAYHASRIAAFFSDRLVRMDSENPVYEEDPVIRPVSVLPPSDKVVTIVFSQKGKWLYATDANEIPIDAFADRFRANTFILLCVCGNPEFDTAAILESRGDIIEFELALLEAERTIASIGCFTLNYNRLPAIVPCTFTFESEPETVLIDGMPFSPSEEISLTEGLHSLAICQEPEIVFFSFEVGGSPAKRRFFIPASNRFPVTPSSLRYYSVNAPAGYYPLSDKYFEYYGAESVYWGSVKALYLIQEKKAVILRETVLSRYPVNTGNLEICLYSALPLDGLILVQFVIASDSVELFSRYFTVKNGHLPSFTEGEDRASIMDSEWFTYLSQREDLEVSVKKLPDPEVVSTSYESLETPIETGIRKVTEKIIPLSPYMFLAEISYGKAHLLHSLYGLRDVLTAY